MNLDELEKKGSFIFMACEGCGKWMFKTESEPDNCQDFRNGIEDEIELKIGLPEIRLLNDEELKKAMDEFIKENQ